MKKILVLTYDFPPYVSVGGLRPYSWYTYMKEFNFMPIIVTRQWNNLKGSNLDYISPSRYVTTKTNKTKFGLLIQSPYFPNFANKILLKFGESKLKFLRKTISGFFEITQFFFEVGPKAHLYKSANQYLKSNNVDAIIATGEPFVLFHYAALLSKKYSTPWIADYRDPWTQDNKRGDNIIRKLWDKFLEKKTLKNAAFVTTVSSLFKQEISTLINKQQIHIISNGFNAEYFQNPEQLKDNKKLVICYMGTIYKWHPVESFLKTIIDLVNNKNLEIELHFYGTNKDLELKQVLKKFSDKSCDYIFFHPKTKTDQLSKKLINVNLFLLFNDYENIGTKIYDYLALKRRIILCYTNDHNANNLKKIHYNIKPKNPVSTTLQSDLLKLTNAGESIKNSKELRNTIIKIYDEFKKNRFVEIKSKNIDNYSRKIQTKKLCDLISKINE